MLATANEPPLSRHPARTRPRLLGHEAYPPARPARQDSRRLTRSLRVDHCLASARNLHFGRGPLDGLLGDCGRGMELPMGETPGRHEGANRYRRVTRRRSPSSRPGGAHWPAGPSAGCPGPGGHHPPGGCSPTRATQCRLWLYEGSAASTLSCHPGQGPASSSTSGCERARPTPPGIQARFIKQHPVPSMARRGPDVRSPAFGPPSPPSPRHRGRVVGDRTNCGVR